MTGWTDHLVIAPIVVPMLAGATMILVGDRRRGMVGGARPRLDAGCSSALAVAAARAIGGGAARCAVYRLGDWPALFGIVLVLDRLSALMLALTAVLGLAAFVFSLARWHRAGAHFHPLFQFQLMGLNGAFLTGDLFNLFVFFEVMLAASYGLALHGSGTARVRAGLHYIVDQPGRLAAVPDRGQRDLRHHRHAQHGRSRRCGCRRLAAEDRALLEAGPAVLGIAFLVKAGDVAARLLAARHLCRGRPRRPPRSSRSSARSASTPCCASGCCCSVTRPAPRPGSAARWLLVGGLLTIAFGSIAVLATQNLPRLAAASVLRLLRHAAGRDRRGAGRGDRRRAVLPGQLRARDRRLLPADRTGRARPRGGRRRARGDARGLRRGRGGRRPEDQEEVGVAIPGTIAILGVELHRLRAAAGRPAAALGLPREVRHARATARHRRRAAVPATTWVLLAALILSGLATVVAMTRAGIDAFWASPSGTVPRVRRGRDRAGRAAARALRRR